MRGRGILAAAALLLYAAAAQGGLVIGDQMLVDVGVCWDGGMGYPGYGPVNAGNYHPPTSDPGAHGAPTTPASDGNYWNNFSANNGGPIVLVNTAGGSSGVTLNMNQWSTCGDGGNVYGIDEAHNLYLPKAQTDCRWWSEARQVGQVSLTGLDTGLMYDVKVLSYVSADADLADIGQPFPAGTVDFAVGTVTVTIDPVGNTTTLAEFLGVAPDASGELVISMVANTPDTCGVPLNVIDITVVPEPATLVVLGVGAALALRRRRRR